MVPGGPGVGLPLRRPRHGLRQHRPREAAGAAGGAAAAPAEAGPALPGHAPPPPLAARDEPLVPEDDAVAAPVHRVRGRPLDQLLPRPHGLLLGRPVRPPGGPRGLQGDLAHGVAGHARGARGAECLRVVLGDPARGGLHHRAPARRDARQQRREGVLHRAHFHRRLHLDPNHQLHHGHADVPRPQLHRLQADDGRPELQLQGARPHPRAAPPPAGVLHRQQERPQGQQLARAHLSDVAGPAGRRGLRAAQGVAPAHPVPGRSLEDIHPSPGAQDSPGDVRTKRALRGELYALRPPAGRLRDGHEQRSAGPSARSGLGDGALALDQVVLAEAEHCPRALVHTGDVTDPGGFRAGVQGPPRESGTAAQALRQVRGHPGHHRLRPAEA
mmetsp:Transcript_81900/g.221834  ORF Transcript_81900/g.221834 Transcript_81900/m.221834 type:complete len:386 (+) Transcript_81900:386-1543(+)